MLMIITAKILIPYVGVNFYIVNNEVFAFSNNDICRLLLLLFVYFFCKLIMLSV